jgi:hypothetical protein
VISQFKNRSIQSKLIVLELTLLTSWLRTFLTGNKLESIRFEAQPDLGDDWVVFTFGPADPAANLIRVRRSGAWWC